MPISTPSSLRARPTVRPGRPSQTPACQPCSPPGAGSNVKRGGGPIESSLFRVRREDGTTTVDGKDRTVDEARLVGQEVGDGRRHSAKLDEVAAPGQQPLQPVGGVGVAGVCGVLAQRGGRSGQGAILWWLGGGQRLRSPPAWGSRRRTLAELAEGLHGELVTPARPPYDEARSIWNGAHDARPAAVVRCVGVSDVLRGVEFARSEGLPLAVRAGGHSIPGFSTTNGGIVLDLPPMTGIRVDPASRRVVAQAGCRWSDLDRETQAFGLAVTGGPVSSTGIAGFTLGGGLGWLVRRRGLA